MNHDDYLDLEEELPVLILVDDEGEEHEFELLAEMEIENDTYRVLIPVEYEDDEVEDDDEIEVEIVILRVVYDEEGTEFLCDIEDDEEWERVADAWQDLLETQEL